MIQYLKIPTTKALKETQLLDLGKINVICGKNNSGKTTLLEAIYSSQRSIGKIVDKDTTEFFYQHLAWLTERYSSGTHETIEQRIRRALRETVRTDELWFADQKGDFAHKISQIVRLSEANQSTVKAWEQFFTDDFKTILLPPKRQLELIQTVRSDQEVLPSGEGILNALFYAKNQDTASDLNRGYQLLSNAFIEISSGYTFDVFFLHNNQVSLSFAYKDRSYIHAKDCGLGLQDLLVILFFSLHPEYKIILVEEPESHLHPEIQKRLLAFFRDSTDKQFFITTHSNVFLNNAFVDRVFFTTFNESVVIDDATSRASILDDLGYSVTDNLVSDLIILVEGPSDVAVIEEFLIKLGLYEAYDIKMWPLGGDIMDQLDLSVLVQSYSIIALLDNDPGSDKIRRRFIRNCEENGITVHRLQRYAIENYFSLRALRQVFSVQIPADITEIKPDEKLEDQIGMNVKGTTRRISKAMTLGEIEGTDLHDFFGKVRELCEEGGAR
jgi:5S rRNA maturation endonuclease (ribonuclease M5)